MPASDKPKLDLTVRGSTGLPVWHGRVYDEQLDELANERGRKVFREMSEQDPIIGGILMSIEFLARQVQWTVKAADFPDAEYDPVLFAEPAAQPADDAEPDDSDPAEAGEGEDDAIPLPIGPQKPPKTEDQKIAEEVATFIDQCLSDMRPSWGMALSEILSMLVYGWSWLEILYKRRNGFNLRQRRDSSLFDDGKIGWSGFAIRGQDTLWRWLYEDDDPDKELIGMEQNAPPHYNKQEVPRWKSLHFTTKGRKDNPEGVSLLRNAYRSWYMKKNIEVIEGIGIERDLAGLPILWAPSELFSTSASAEEKALLAHLQEIVTSIKRDEQEGILMPMAYDAEGKNPLYKIELLNTGGDRQFDTSRIIQRYDERMAMSMMADFLLMGHDSSAGSFALSSTKTTLFSNALSAILDIIIEEINVQAVPQLVLLNGWELKYCPTLQHGKIDATDLRALGEYLRQLNAAGMPLFPNKALEVYLLESAGLPSDPGAGELPSPMFGTIEDQGLLDPNAINPMMDVAAAQAQLTKQQAKTEMATQKAQKATGKDGDLGDAPDNRPQKGKSLRSTPVHTSSIQKRPQNVALRAQQRATLRQPKRYVPLGARMMRASEALKAMFYDEPGAYEAFVMRAMEAQSFSALSDEDAALLRRAEAAS